MPHEAEKEFAFPRFDILMVHSLKAYSKVHRLLSLRETFILANIAQPRFLGHPQAGDKNVEACTTNIVAHPEMTVSQF